MSVLKMGFSENGAEVHLQKSQMNPSDGDRRTGAPHWRSRHLRLGTGYFFFQTQMADGHNFQLSNHIKPIFTHPILPALWFEMSEMSRTPNQHGDDEGRGNAFRHRDSFMLVKPQWEWSEKEWE